MDHLKLKNELVRHEQEHMAQTTNFVKYVLDASENASLMLGESVPAAMEVISKSLLEFYGLRPDFAEWDLEALKREYEVDIYIINEHNIVAYSTFIQDIGLDFRKCCEKLSRSLDERRAAGGFYFDGLDVEQNSGELKAYSYMATPDKQAIIQLGYAVKQSETFRRFNFMNTLDQIIRDTPYINDIRILNMGGHAYGVLREESEVLSEARRAAFNHAWSTGEASVLEGDWQGASATYRYERYTPSVEGGVQRGSVIELVYNDYELSRALADNFRNFMWKIAAVLAVAILLAIAITKWLARPMHLAFHDSLTGLKSRAAFNQLPMPAGKLNTAALLMIDLDHFKAVNDTHGHDAGDELLRAIAKCIHAQAGARGMTYRMGGDEFIQVLPGAAQAEAEAVARRILEAIRDIVHSNITLSGQIAASIGIALAPAHGTDRDTLCKKADEALYQAKRQGKNQYRVYNE